MRQIQAYADGAAVAAEEIYDAAFDDDSFAQLASKLAQSFGARSALVHWIHRDGATDILTHSGYFTDDQLALYAREFVQLDPWVDASARAQSANFAQNLEELVPLPQFVASAFYNEYVRGIGDDTCRCLGVRLESEFGSGFIALQRGLTQDAFDERAVSELSRSFPAISRLLSLRGMFAASSHRERTLTAALDALGHPVWLVDEAMRLHHANAAAEAILTTGRVLRVRRGRLTTAADGNASRLKTAVERALAPSGPEACAVVLPWEPSRPLHLSVTPIAPAGGKRLAMLIAAQPAEDASRAGRLRTFFGLSRAEAELAVLLADGHSPAEIAERRGVSLATVRVQLRNIASKLGCNRQSDVVRAVTSMPALMVQDRDSR